MNSLEALECVKLTMKWNVDKKVFDSQKNNFDIIENSLKALEIIKEKRVDIKWLKKSENCSKYNLGIGINQRLKRTQYDLLKEIFNE